MNKVFLMIGILCFLVPGLLQIAEQKEQNSIIDTYQKEVESSKEDVLIECLEKAVEYNEMLFEVKQSAVGKNVILDYNDQLNITSTGLMGHLEIPKIKVHLPIYHGTSDDVLMVGIGHLEGTSLPVGGENVHTVLTGHSGLPSAELFTRLDEMKISDQFYLHTCNQSLAYEVTEIQVVEPKQVEVLEIIAGKDRVTLITCTPYGINTHRLLVTGERIEEVDHQEIVVETKGDVDEKIYYIMGIVTLLILVLFCGGIYRKFGYCSK